jgi:Cys-tRNA(Pro)/Cys-tRNA(Cys) deacylase
VTPAINAARKAGIAFRIHEYEHDPGAASYGLEAAEKLGIAPGARLQDAGRRAG